MKIPKTGIIEAVIRDCTENVQQMIRLSKAAGQNVARAEVVVWTKASVAKAPGRLREKPTSLYGVYDVTLTVNQLAPYDLQGPNRPQSAKFMVGLVNASKVQVVEFSMADVVDGAIRYADERGRSWDGVIGCTVRRTRGQREFVFKLGADIEIPQVQATGWLPISLVAATLV